MYCHDLKREIDLAVCHEESCPHREYCRIFNRGAENIARRAPVAAVKA